MKNTLDQMMKIEFFSPSSMENALYKWTCPWAFFFCGYPDGNLLGWEFLTLCHGLFLEFFLIFFFS